MNVPSADGGILIRHKEIEHEGPAGIFRHGLDLVFGQRFPLGRRLFQGRSLLALAALGLGITPH